LASKRKDVKKIRKKPIKRKPRSKEDFTHNYAPIRIRCPICFQNITPVRIVSFHKNLPSLWWHLKHDCFYPSQEKLSEIKEILKKISKALDWGML